MVQVTEENRCLSLSLSNDEKCSPKWLKLRSSLIELIQSKKKKLCPSADFVEYFVSPSQLGLLTYKSLSQLTIFEMKSTARSALLQSKFVRDVSQKERIAPWSLLLADPYLVLHHSLVQELFDAKKAHELAPSSLLKEVRHHITDIPIPESTTHQSLQRLLNGFSVFASRNPLVSAI